MKKMMLGKLGTMGMMKTLLSATSLAAQLPFNLLSGSDEDLKASKSSPVWEEEREDILERANWLCKKIIVDPEQLVAEAPEVIGRNFGCQWAMYSCSMLAHAIANISVLYPDKKSKCPELIAHLIDIVNTPVLREYDTNEWHEDAMESLSGDKSHMTYLSILAWMITNYKMIGGDGRYDNILHACCEALNRRMMRSKYDLNLLSFPHKQIFLPDMLVTIVALRNYGRLYNGKYADTVDAWLHNAKTIWIDRKTGLLAGLLPGASKYQKGIRIRGSYAALNCSYLTLIDENFALQQYELLKKHLTGDANFMGKNVIGVKEYLNRSPKFEMKAGDAGLVIMGLSAGGTAFGLGAPTFFGDWNTRYEFLRTAEIAGDTVKENGMRHYKLSEMFLVGEATALAMRTNIKR